MNQRERMLAAVIGLIVGGFLLQHGYSEYIQKPLSQRQKQLVTLQNQVLLEETRVKAAKRSETELQQWKQLGLGVPSDLAQTLYSNFLVSEFEKLKIDNPAITQSSPTPNKKGEQVQYIACDFKVVAEMKLEKLLRFLDDFYATPLLHKIESLKLTPLVKENKLEQFKVELSIEVLAFVDSPNDKQLPEPDKLPAELVPSRLLTETQIKEVEAKNIFQPTKLVKKEERRPTPPPSPEPDRRKDYRLMATVSVNGRGQLLLENKSTGEAVFVGVGERLPIKGVEAEVLAVEPGLALFRVGDKVAQLNASQTLDRWELAEPTDEQKAAFVPPTTNPDKDT